jgi:hypothetical protein
MQRTDAAKTAVPSEWTVGAMRLRKSGKRNGVRVGRRGKIRFEFILG